MIPENLLLTAIKDTTDYALRNFLWVDGAGLLHSDRASLPAELRGSTKTLTVELSDDKEKGMKLALVDWNGNKELCTTHAKTKGKFCDNMEEVVRRYYEYQELTA